jgi:hypothetical protein
MSGLGKGKPVELRLEALVLPPPDDDDKPLVVLKPAKLVLPPPDGCDKPLVVLKPAKLVLPPPGGDDKPLVVLKPAKLVLPPPGGDDNPRVVLKPAKLVLPPPGNADKREEMGPPSPPNTTSARPEMSDVTAFVQPLPNPPSPPNVCAKGCDGELSQPTHYCTVCGAICPFCVEEHKRQRKQYCDHILFTCISRKRYCDHEVTPLASATSVKLDKKQKRMWRKPLGDDFEGTCTRERTFSQTAHAESVHLSANETEAALAYMLVDDSKMIESAQSKEIPNTRSPKKSRIMTTCRLPKGQTTRPLSGVAKRTPLSGVAKRTKKLPTKKLAGSAQAEIKNKAQNNDDDTLSEPTRKWYVDEREDTWRDELTRRCATWQEMKKENELRKRNQVLFSSLSHQLITERGCQKISRDDMKKYALRMQTLAANVRAFYCEGESSIDKYGFSRPGAVKTQGFVFDEEVRKYVSGTYGDLTKLESVTPWSVQCYQERNGSNYSDEQSTRFCIPTFQKKLHESGRMRRELMPQEALMEVSKKEHSDGWKWLKWFNEEHQDKIGSLLVSQRSSDSDEESPCVYDAKDWEKMAKQMCENLWVTTYMCKFPSKDLEVRLRCIETQISNLTKAMSECLPNLAAERRRVLAMEFMHKNEDQFSHKLPAWFQDIWDQELKHGMQSLDELNQSKHGRCCLR